MESPNSLTSKEARQVKKKVKSMLIIFSYIKGIVHKKFVMVGQTGSSTYYCDILQRQCENMRRLHPELWQQKNQLFHHDNTPPHTSFFAREFLTRSNMTVIPRPPYFPLFFQFKIKLKGQYFDTIEANEAESRSVLNTLTEHDFQDTFKKWHSLGMEGDYCDGHGGQ
jgi:hypothetical protein